MLWTLLGQVVAVETLVFVLLRPKLLKQLHEKLSERFVSISRALQDLGLVKEPLEQGEQRLICCGL